MLFCLPQDGGVTSYHFYISGRYDFIGQTKALKYDGPGWSRGCVQTERGCVFFLEVWLLLSCSCEHLMLDAFGLICSCLLQRWSSLWRWVMENLLSQHVLRERLLLVEDMGVWSKRRCLQVDPPGCWFRDVQLIFLLMSFTGNWEWPQPILLMVVRKRGPKENQCLLDSDTNLVDSMDRQVNGL